LRLFQVSGGQINAGQPIGGRGGARAGLYGANNDRGPAWPAQPGATVMNVRAAVPAVDLNAVKTRQQGAWSSGDYAMVGTTLQIVGEMLCEAADIRSGQHVLDVAAGNGNASLAAARRFAEVVSTDYVGALLERGRERAAAERLPLTFQEADAENLPFADASFDVVLSTFGVMFTPDQERAARELVRVCRPGGKIALANWTPESFIGKLFKTMGKYLPPAAGVKSPSLWGNKEHLQALFGAQAGITTQSRNFVFRYRSPQHWLEIFRDYYGPVLKAFAALDQVTRDSLEADIYALLDAANVAKDGTLVAPSEYLEVVITRR
jgi:ubiquinone/menaquinone biosynthesis C-methylase UbiE